MHACKHLCMEDYARVQAPVYGGLCTRASTCVRRIMHACKHLCMEANARVQAPVYGGLCTCASTCVWRIMHTCKHLCMAANTRMQAPVCGGDSLQEVHVHQGAGKVEGVSQLVSEVNKLQYLNRGEEMIDTQTHVQTHEHRYIHVL